MLSTEQLFTMVTPGDEERYNYSERYCRSCLFFILTVFQMCFFPPIFVQTTKTQLGVFIQFRSIAFVIKKLTAGPAGVEGDVRARRGVARESRPLPARGLCETPSAVIPCVRRAEARGSDRVSQSCSLTGLHTVVPPKRGVLLQAL